MSNSTTQTPAETPELLAARAAKIAKTSAGLRTRARRSSKLLNDTDIKYLFRAAASYMERIPQRTFARLEALRLVDSDRRRRKLSAITELGYETRDVLRTEYAAA